MRLSDQRINRTRKDHLCEGCGKPIPAGCQAYKYTGIEDGIFSLYYHPDCREAEIQLNELHSLMWDEWISLRDIEREDHEWLRENHAVVAARLFSLKL